MQKSAGSWLVFCLLVIVCLQAASCTGTPPLFNTVILHASSRQVGPNTQVTITATVPQDKTNAGVTWVFILPTPPPANPGTFTSTPTQAIYTSPVTVPSKFTVTIRATSIALPTETNTITITVVPPPTLKISTKSPLPPGTEFASYTVQLQATGGVSPYSWSLANGTTLPTGLSLAADGTISGAPTVTGTFNFSVEVTDSEVPPVKTTPTALQITVTNLLNGNYVFELSGFNASGAVAIAGSFTADGNVTLSNGVEDSNSTSGSPKNQTFTGTYTLGSDNRGTLTFTSIAGSPTFAFAIDATGSYGRMIEFDSSGVRGSGQIEKRSVSTCVSNTLNGEYAFGITGQAIATALASAGPVVAVGSFGATPPVGSGVGSIGPGESDTNTPGGITTGQSVSGTYQTTSQNTRCTIALSQSIGTMNFSVYPVSSSEAFLVETDQVTTSEPFLTAGKLLAQPGFPFSTANAGSTFNATSVAGLTGQFLSGTTYVPDLALILLTGTGTSSYTISITENQGGTAVAFAPGGATFVNPDQFGRVDSGISTPIRPIFYIVGQNEAFCIGELINDPFFGIFEPQSPSPFSITASDLNSTFVMGTSLPATSPVRDLSGTVTLANTSTTAGNVNGKQDQSASSGNTAAQTVTGTYSGLVSTTGAGAVSLTAPAAFSGQFLVVSPTKIVVLTTTTGDTDPVLIFLGNCASTCGED